MYISKMVCDLCKADIFGGYKEVRIISYSEPHKADTSKRILSFEICHRCLQYNTIKNFFDYMENVGI